MVPPALEVYDTLDNKDIDVDIDAMEEVTEEAEDNVEMDTELLEVMRQMPQKIDKGMIF